MDNETTTIIIKDAPYRYGSELEQKQHRILLEFLFKAKNVTSETEFTELKDTFFTLSDYKFLAGFVPENRRYETWPDYFATLTKVFNKELDSYDKKYFTATLEELNTSVQVSELAVSSYTPLDFLNEAACVKTTEEYNKLYSDKYSFHSGRISPVSPQKVALFDGMNALPKIIYDNTPENWVKLYKIAFNNNINPQNCIPTTSEVATQGIGLISSAKEEMNNVISEAWHKNQFSVAENSIQAAIAPITFSVNDTDNVHINENDETQMKQKIFKDFILNQYKEGTVVPPFGSRNESGNITIMNKCTFSHLENSSQTVILNYKDGTIPISKKLYEQIVNNAHIMADAPTVTQEITEQYEKIALLDQEKVRVNTAANYWHNYKALCRTQASNPVEAMEIAKSIINEMSSAEQKKIKQSIHSHEKLTKTSYNQRILSYYVDNVKDIPFKNHSIHSKKALEYGTALTVDVEDRKGKKFDPAINMKIGDTVRMRLDCKDLFGKSFHKLPSQKLTVISSSNELNKVILVDSTGLSKYTLAKDDFIKRIKVLEKKQERITKKLQKEEEIGYSF